MRAYSLLHNQFLYSFQKIKSFLKKLVKHQPSTTCFPHAKFQFMAFCRSRELTYQKFQFVLYFVKYKKESLDGHQSPKSLSYTKYEIQPFVNHEKLQAVHLCYQSASQPIN